MWTEEVLVLHPGPHLLTSAYLLFLGQIFVNHSVALDSPWLHPQESLWPLGHEKPHVLANRVAVSVSSPLPTVLFAPQPVPGGCREPGSCATSFPLVNFKHANWVV